MKQGAPIKIEVSCPIQESFHVEQCAGMFDVDVQERSTQQWTITPPDLDGDWRIGAIVGPSGSGKSVAARHLFGDCLVTGHKWPANRALIDVLCGAGESDEGMMRQAAAMLNSVGFSSPPDWVKPYRVLSNGQKFRADLARSLLHHNGKIVAFDEFTSVVDRQVAQFGSAAVAKTVRRTDGMKFVAVTCHYDVLDWLEPDWILELPTGTLARGRLQQRRPAIQIDVRLATREAWPAFAVHHYLNHKLHRASRCYLAWWRDQPIAFHATMQVVSPHGGGRRQSHRLVVLPDFQGMGVGMALLDAVADHELKAVRGCRHFGITTSHPALIRALDASAAWQLKGVNKGTKINESLRKTVINYASSSCLLRYRASFGYAGASHRNG